MEISNSWPNINLVKVIIGFLRGDELILQISFGKKNDQEPQTKNYE